MEWRVDFLIFYITKSFSLFKHKFFGVDKIAKDQVGSMAERKGMSFEEMEKWLGANLGYQFRL